MTTGIEPYPVTKEGLEEIKQKLDHLKGFRREEVSVKLEAAIAQGDLKENADYHAAKEEQGFIEGEIRDLEDKLRRAKIIENIGPSNTVRVGSTVTVLEIEFDEEAVYQIVGPHEADPTNGRISNESAWGKALIGGKKGQTVQVNSPGGLIDVQIMNIE